MIETSGHRESILHSGWRHRRGSCYSRTGTKMKYGTKREIQTYLSECTQYCMYIVAVTDAKLIEFSRYNNYICNICNLKHLHHKLYGREKFLFASTV